MITTMAEDGPSSMSSSAPASATAIRSFSVPLPDRIRALPVDPRGYPVPFFVKCVNGSYDFRVMDVEAGLRALRVGLCWICGQKLGRFVAFVGGPKSELTCGFADLPSHLDCATFAAQTCPFMVLPAARMRTADLPEEASLLPAQTAENPGITAVVATRKWHYNAEAGHCVVDHKEKVLWFTRGRPASDEEIYVAKKTAMEDVARLRKKAP